MLLPVKNCIFNLFLLVIWFFNFAFKDFELYKTNVKVK